MRCELRKHGAVCEECFHTYVTAVWDEPFWCPACVAAAPDLHRALRDLRPVRQLCRYRAGRMIA